MVLYVFAVVDKAQLLDLVFVLWFRFAQVLLMLPLHVLYLLLQVQDRLFVVEHLLLEIVYLLISVVQCAPLFVLLHLVLPHSLVILLQLLLQLKSLFVVVFLHPFLFLLEQDVLHLPLVLQAMNIFHWDVLQLRVQFSNHLWLSRARIHAHQLKSLEYLLKGIVLVDSNLPQNLHKSLLNETFKTIKVPGCLFLFDWYEHLLQLLFKLLLLLLLLNYP